MFQITLHEKDLKLLEQIKNYFDGVGHIYLKKGNNAVEYRVGSKKDLKVLIDHFDKYPLITQKLADYLLWKSVVELVSNKEHLTREGLEKIVAIKASINRGLPNKLLEAFPNVTPWPRDQVTNKKILDPNWLAGFASAEGNFGVIIFKSNTKSGFGVKINFTISQHSRDELLLKSFMEYLGCGVVQSNKDDSISQYRTHRLLDINSRIIPFFEKYPILGEKSLNFEDFCQVSRLMTNRDHLTEIGLDQIRKIKGGMNKGRVKKL